MSDVRLQELFDFDEADLAANRGCRLSSRQEKRIKQADLQNFRLFWGAGITAILVVVFNTVNEVSAWAQGGFSFSQSNLSGFFSRIGIPGLLFASLAWMLFRIAAERTSPVVRQVCGRAGILKRQKLLSEKKPNGSMFYRVLPQYDLVIGKVIFEDMSPQILNVVRPGDRYILYYLKSTKDVLSVERVQ